MPARVHWTGPLTAVDCIVDARVPAAPPIGSEGDTGRQQVCMLLSNDQIEPRDDAPELGHSRAHVHVEGVEDACKARELLLRHLLQEAVFQGAILGELPQPLPLFLLLRRQLESQHSKVALKRRAALQGRRGLSSTRV
jgi:hypothetical protein